MAVSTAVTVGLSALGVVGVTGVAGLVIAATPIVISGITCAFVAWGAQKLIRKCLTKFNKKLQKKRLDKLAIKLGIDVDATDESIASSCRRAALHVHPDKGGSSELFIQLKNDYKNFLKLRVEQGHSNMNVKSWYEFISEAFVKVETKVAAFFK